MHRIVLIGAGSTNFGLGVVGDIFKSNFLEGSTIILHDINAKALDNTFKIASEYKEKLGKEITIESTTSRKKALKGASFCLISIEVGNRFDLWDQDWKIPLQYGVKQVYGENGGPGGLFHSLRIIPPILEICEDIQAICPDAYVFNYSNPMQRVCHAVTTKFPDLKFIGLCHEIESMRRQLPSLMETELSNIEFRAGGLNHFSILLDAKFKNNGKTDPLDPETFPYLTIEKEIFFPPTMLFAATNNLSDTNLLAPYRLIGLTALSVDKATTFFTFASSIGYGFLNAIDSMAPAVDLPIPGRLSKESKSSGICP